MALSLPIAWISLSKLLAFLVALGVLVAALHRQNKQLALRQLHSLRWVLVALALFAASLLWTIAPDNVGLAALLKHGKLLLPFLLVALVRTRSEARLALLLFALGQCFLVCLSWLNAAGMPLPWASTQTSGSFAGIVFTSYLDQSIIFSVTAAVLWHLRREGMWPAWLAAPIALAMLGNVMLLLPGRTGYVTAVLVVALAAMWAMPPRWRVPALVLVPVLAIAALWFGSAKTQSRIALVYTEAKTYGTAADLSTSSGIRLHFWKRSLQAIAQQPFSGHGVGAWTEAVKRLEGSRGDAVVGSGNLSNPHQEYLLWGVELGLAGLLLLPALMLALLRDFLGLRQAVGRAGISVVCAMAAACLFNSSLFDGLIGDYFCILLGLLLAYGLALQNEPTAPSHIPA